MIASDNEYLEEASNTLFRLNADFNIRERCRNREEYQNMITRFEQQTAELERKDAEIQCLQAEIERLKSMLKH